MREPRPNLDNSLFSLFLFCRKADGAGSSRRYFRHHGSRGGGRSDRRSGGHNLYDLQKRTETSDGDGQRPVSTSVTMQNGADGKSSIPVQQCLAGEAFWSYLTKEALWGMIATLQTCTLNILEITICDYIRIISFHVASSQDTGYLNEQTTFNTSGHHI